MSRGNTAEEEYLEPFGAFLWVQHASYNHRYRSQSLLCFRRQCFRATSKIRQTAVGLPFLKKFHHLFTKKEKQEERRNGKRVDSSVHSADAMTDTTPKTGLFALAKRLISTAQQAPFIPVMLYTTSDVVLIVKAYTLSL